MSQPGRYVVIKDSVWWTVSIGTGGYEIDQTMVLGLDVTLAALSIYEPSREWEAYHYGEDALIDLDRRVLIVNTTQLDSPLRSVFLDALRRVWPGWEIRWAYAGLDTFANYLGLELPPIDPGQPSWLDASRPRPDPSLLTFDRLGPSAHLMPAGYTVDREQYAVPLTVVDGVGAVRTYAMDQDDPWYGTALLDLLPPDGDVRFCGHPSMGLHLDIAAKSAGLWTIHSYHGLERYWPAIWPGWTLDLWGDHYELQIRLGGGLLVEPQIDGAEARRRFGERLDDLWLPWLRERLDDPRNEAFYQRISYNPYPRYRAEAIGLTEQRYRDLRELATGIRHSPQRDALWNSMLTA